LGWLRGSRETTELNPRVFGLGYPIGKVLGLAICDRRAELLVQLRESEPSPPFEPAQGIGLASRDAREHVEAARLHAVEQGLSTRPSGREGLVILDIERPHQPHVDQLHNAGGCIDDVNDVKLGITYVSELPIWRTGEMGCEWCS
jgi:hypothetical protein